jgi:uncharacterized Zn finger protein
MSASKRPPTPPPPRERWSPWPDAPRGPKPPPPAHGIKIKDAGTTWWGRRWIEALEKLSPEYASRLARGKTYARTGRAHDLAVKAGKVTANVTGSRARPYAISMSMAVLDDATWTKALAELAQKARYAAQLLAGEMPEDVDEVLRKVGVRIFPSKVGDLTTACSCPDWANPCKHVAATHYVLGDALDKDPFLLFELRGRTRDEVLAAMRRAKPAPRTDAAPAAPGVKLGAITDESYDTWRGPPPSLRVTFAAPAVDAALIAALGKPASWREKASPLELLRPFVRAAGDLGRQLALQTSAGDGSPVYEEAPGPGAGDPQQP